MSRIVIHPAGVLRASSSRRRRGFIIVTMLVFLSGMIMLAAAFSLNSTANLSATQANAHLVQARQAAEAGIYAVMHQLSDPVNLVDMSAWYDNRDAYHGMVVWSSSENSSSYARGIDIQEGASTWRFSIVADDPNDDRILFRYGITDEASKLNINRASKEQLEALFNALVRDESVDPKELVASLVDWRDEDSETTEGGAEEGYYQSLKTPYRSSNGALDTVEELLLVKGFTASILFGEDLNRNGLLEPNEDDGEESLPETDNADGELDRGLFPYLTVYSWDRNASNLNEPRINLNDDNITGLEERLTKLLSPEVVAFIVDYRRQNQRFQSVTQLLTLENTLVTLQDMEILMDQTNITQIPAMVGLVNINTASRTVLRALGVLDEREVDEIVQMRASMDPLTKATLAWPLTLGIIQPDRYEQYGVAERFLTTRSLQFTVEAIGFADHVGTYKRIQAVVEVLGPIGNIRYYRDLTLLGIGYRVRPTEEGLASFDSTGS